MVSRKLNLLGSSLIKAMETILDGGLEMASKEALPSTNNHDLSTYNENINEAHHEHTLCTIKGGCTN